MTDNEIKVILASVQAEFEKCKEPEAIKSFTILFNLVETLYSDLCDLKADNQKLNDEINRLKGEQGKPKIKENTRGLSQQSTETERREAEDSVDENVNTFGYKLDKKILEKFKEQHIPYHVIEQLDTLIDKKFEDKQDFITAMEKTIGKDSTAQYKKQLLKQARYKKRKREKKVEKIVIDREKYCPVDKSILPDDAVPCGHESKVVQDIIIKSDNVKFTKEVYYSPSLHKTFTGIIPPGYDGEFGPHINTQIFTMKYINNISQPKILESLTNYGVIISGTYISDYLIKSNQIEAFHEEKDMLFKTGLECGIYKNIDDTGTRVNGKNYYTQIICDQNFTTFFTTQRKDRLTILDILRNFNSRFFLFNKETYELLDKLCVSKKVISELTKITSNNKYSEKEIEKLLDRIFPNPPKGNLTRIRIKEASAIAFYHQETGIPIVEILVCDNAPQFKLITKNIGLCWVHDGRHYKKLTPIVPANIEKKESFGKEYWCYYEKLLVYKKNPTAEQACSLDKEFDELFSTKTGYEELDDRIAKSLKKKKELLLVLKYPEIPLHNNCAENAARVEKRKQDVSFQTRNDCGTKAKDTMMSIVETCKKLGINAFAYIFDRVSKNFKMPSIAEMIKNKFKKDNSKFK